MNWVPQKERKHTGLEWHGVNKYSENIALFFVNFMIKEFLVIVKHLNKIVPKWYSCTWQCNDMMYKALGLYWGGFTWTENTNTVSAELVCSWARVKSSHEGRRSLGQRSKAFSVFLLSHQSQNSADPTQGLEDWSSSPTGGTWWPLNKTLSTVSSEERGTPISQSVTDIENEWWMQTENISRYWCSVISPSPSCVMWCVFVA